HWLPFYVLFLLRAAEQAGRRNMLLAGLFLVLTAWTDWYYTLFLLLLTAGYAAWRLLARTPNWPARRRLVAHLAGIGALFALGAGGAGGRRAGARPHPAGARRLDWRAAARPPAREPADHPALAPARSLRCAPHAGAGNDGGLWRAGPATNCKLQIADCRLQS